MEILSNEPPFIEILSRTRSNLLNNDNKDINVKYAVKAILRISSAYNKGEPADINFAQILNLSNFF